MPEGDSVFKLAARLRPDLDGKRLRDGELRVAAHATARLAGLRVLGHETHGKHLLTRFDNGDTLHTHLRMTGSWSVTRGGRRLPSRFAADVRVRLATEDGTTAYGLLLPVVDLLPTADEARVVGHLGPDPLRADWDEDEAVTRLGRDPDRAVVDALLDQRLMAGLGNLWANELAYLRGLHPWRAVATVDLPALVRLAHRTLTISATVPGMYQVTTGNRSKGEQHWVTGRAGRPCLRCGTTVRVVDDAHSPSGRRTWWCPVCQPERQREG